MATLNDYSATGNGGSTGPSNPNPGAGLGKNLGCPGCGSNNNSSSPVNNNSDTPPVTVTPPISGSQQPPANNNQVGNMNSGYTREQVIKNQIINKSKTPNMAEQTSKTLNAARYTSWRNYPVLPPITFTGTLAGGTTSMYFTDSAGLFATYSGTAGGQAFTGASGGPSVANLHLFLQSMWIYVRNFNLDSTQVSTLSNNLQQIPSDPDGLNKPIVISSGANISNQQYNPNLVNNCYAFILSFADALKLPTSGTNGEVVTLTLVPGAVGFYGADLQDFINTNPSFATGAPLNC